MMPNEGAENVSGIAVDRLCIMNIIARASEKLNLNSGSDRWESLVCSRSTLLL